MSPRSFFLPSLINGSGCNFVLYVCLFRKFLKSIRVNRGVFTEVAISSDMLSWEKYERPIIEYGKLGEIDSIHARKPCVIYHDGALWHFYCAVRHTVTNEEKEKFGNEFRCLTVARSKPS